MTILAAFLILLATWCMEDLIGRTAPMIPQQNYDMSEDRHV
jgi:hypothetical protein